MSYTGKDRQYAVTYQEMAPTECRVTYRMIHDGWNWVLQTADGTPVQLDMSEWMEISRRELI